ncbi:hypothetical protein [Gorillibacterium sp. sgz5001074]|uniref:hypothetical protein n=1 Tax=Gorillibacterium sp. sgz5001074 TaxID=3446695 RepID=UPI003F678F2B
MFTYIKEGFRASVRQPFPVLVLFLYRFVWGVTLYKLSQSVILPLLHRYPDADGFTAQTRLFLAEGQFVLFKTDVSHSYLWLLAGLLGLRMVLTPLLNAGLFYSLAHTQYNAGYRFVRGVAELSRPYLLLYAIQMLLTLVPLWWVLPELKSALLSSGTYQELARSALPYTSLMLGYGFLLHLLFLHIQFGRVHAEPLSRSVTTALRSLPLVLGIGGLLVLLGTLASLAMLGGSIVWAGFWALAVYQAYRLLQTLFSVWGIAAQHRLFTAKSGLH